MAKRDAELEEVFKVAKRFEVADDLARNTLENTDRVFYIQKALLCNVSDYFVKALGSGFHEQTTNSLILPGCDVETLEVFIYSLCNRTLPDSVAIVERHTAGSPECAAAMCRQQHLLVKLWIFGEAHLIARLQNVAMSRLYSLLLKAVPNISDLCLAFAQAPEGSALRQILIEQVVHNYGKTAPKGKPYYTDAELDRLGAIPGVTPALLRGCMRCNSGHCCASWWVECKEGGANSSKTVLQKYLVPEP